MELPLNILLFQPLSHADNKVAKEHTQEVFCTQSYFLAENLLYLSVPLSLHNVVSLGGRIRARPHGLHRSHHDVKVVAECALLEV